MMIATRAKPLPLTTHKDTGPSWLVVIYVALMPLLVGLPRGTIIPILRPSEGLQLLVTGIAVLLAAKAMFAGSRWRLRFQPSDGWLLVTAACGSILPLLWFSARGQVLGTEQILAAFPFVKYAALFLLVRVAVRERQQALMVIRATTISAMIIATLATAQAIGFDPLLDTLGRFFISGSEDVVDAGRATTTIGSAIATGAYLSISCGIALSQAFRTGQKYWVAASLYIAIGALASGQVGTVLALAVTVTVVAYLYRRLAQVLLCSLPAAALGLIGLWPIVATRLADIDQGSGLPKSWLIRWNNLSELYLPSLGDGGWILGVSPDARVIPPEVWREVVYLESGYLWLLWVGGVPLLAAVMTFLIVAWRDLAPAQATITPPNSPRSSLSAGASEQSIGHSIRVAGRAGVAMIVLLSVIDPHLTLRAGADLFFVLVALGLGQQLAVPSTGAAKRWRRLMASPATPSLSAARIRLTEAEMGATLLPDAFCPEARLLLEANLEGQIIGSSHVVLARKGNELHGFVDRTTIGQASNVCIEQIERHQADALIWRAVALSASSLRMHSLHVTDGPLLCDTRPHHDGFVADAQELRSAGLLAKKLEVHRTGSPGTDPTADRAGRSKTNNELPGVRFETNFTIPLWKRALDLLVGSTIMVLSLPAWAACLVAVRSSSPGPAIYRQVRIGAGGLPFQIYKFRTMYTGNDDSEQRSINQQELAGQIEASKNPNDARITPAGRWLRRFSFDELPQLINVWRGEMSLVGPRPCLLWEVQLFEPTQRRRLQARPGLTGLWQVSGRADISMLHMLDLDLDYVDRMDPALDVRCLVSTASSVLRGDGAR